MAGQAIRVWLDGKSDKDEVRALKAWLEREKPLEELVRGGDLCIEVQVREDTPQGRMGPDWEIVLRVVETFTGIATLVEQTKRAVDAWRINRGRVGRGEPPRPQVEPPRDCDEDSL